MLQWFSLQNHLDLFGVQGFISEQSIGQLFVLFAVFLQDALSAVVGVLNKVDFCELSIGLYLLTKLQCDTDLQEDPDLLLNGSLCLGALLAYIAVGHHTKLQQYTCRL